MKQVRLKRGKEQRIISGHPWVFAGELESVNNQLSPGEMVELLSSRGEVLGCGYANPKSAITIRLLDGCSGEQAAACFESKFAAALAYRSRIYSDESSFRLFFGESDGIPGLVVDKYADYIVVQAPTIGVYSRLDTVVAALVKTVAPHGVLLRNDTPFVELEGMTQEVKVLYGHVPDAVEISHCGLRFRANVFEGQKTGFFFDQRENRLALRGLVNAARLLDCYCYSGAWAIMAATFGARETVGVDVSAKAIGWAKENAALNGVENRCRWVEEDVPTALRRFISEGESFDCIVLDPPTFAKRKDDLHTALAAYKKVNRLAMQLLRPGGILVSCSCSYQVSRHQFEEVLRKAALAARRRALLLEFRGQARDHPVLLAAPETAYLKCAVLRVE